ncbi:MAG: transposase [Armatimonadota bacterium]
MRRRHLTRLDRIFTDSEAYFLTFCTRDRLQVLAGHAAASIIHEAFAETENRWGWLVGRYVIMPDHVHVFVARASDATKPLSVFMRDWKKWTSRRMREAGLPARIWQREFFDHLLRSDESYAQKWEYVRQNPVRAGLASRPEDWPYQGEINAGL